MRISPMNLGFLLPVTEIAANSVCNPFVAGTPGLTSFTPILGFINEPLIDKSFTPNTLTNFDGRVRTL